MGMLLIIVAVMLLSGPSAAGPAVPSTGTCWAMGDPHYRTFDGHYYNFMGNCTYTMAMNCHVGGNHPSFKVEAQNMNQHVNSELTEVGMVTVKVYGMTINIVHDDFGFVRVNHQVWNLPMNLENGKVKLSQSGLSVVLKTDFGLTVQYDWQHYLTITVPGSFAGKVCGMCGNFNNKPGDDMTTPDGSVASNVEALGKSWRVPGVPGDAYCKDECSGPCENCKATEVEQIEHKIICTSIAHMIDQYFPDCHPLIEAEVFQSSCMTDLCRGATMKTYFCDTLHVYSDACQRTGAKGQNWRKAANCPPPTCPENSNYEFCGSACSASCEDPDAPSKCKQSCVETCTCNNGYVLSGTKCVPKAQCGCMYKGCYVEAGATFWGDDSCTKLYKCSAGGRLSVQAESCPLGQECQVVKGVRGCHPVKWVPSTGTCWAMGDPHYRTFDGHYYNFMGNCTYTMAMNCHVGGNHPSFKVEAQNMNQRVNSKLTEVGMVTVKVYGMTINIVHDDFGFVRVNHQVWNLPMNLENGKVKLSQSGLSVVLKTDFGLTVQYDWQHYLTITVPGSFAGKVCGMCGNFNNKPGDDMTTPDGSVASNVEALGKSWRVPGMPGDAYCKDECSGPCENCKATQVEQIEHKIICTSIAHMIDQYFPDCHPLIEAEVFQSSCMTDLCRGATMKTYFCDTLHVYSDACQRTGAKGQNWRKAANCPPPTCPENSNYEFCGSACSASCEDPDAPSKCKQSCVETCTCNNGYVLSGTKCVPKAQCGCMYKGCYVEAGATFWGDDSCTKLYKCSAGGRLSVQAESCPLGQECQVVKGVRGCHPVKWATCMVSGDPHFVTFDGQHYNFQGTCAYELAGVSANHTSPEWFSVVLQTDGRDKKAGSAIKTVEVKVLGYTVVISKEHPGFVMVNDEVNDELSNLPLTIGGGKLQVYKSGWFAVIQTDLGAKVSFDWKSVAFVTVPGTYKGAMQGMCGNYNLNPKDDMQMRDGKQAATPEALGQSWKVTAPHGCVDGCQGPCPGCSVAQKALFATNKYCGLISDPEGPFRDCHAIVDPAGFLQDCVYDVCLYQGGGNMQCKTLTAYTAACQLKGAKVHAWRSAHFCGAQCPSNGHYELCTSGCSGSCQNNSIPSVCRDHCMEGCVCNEGFVLSGDECVPSGQCGCVHKGKYYKHGQVFYPDENCQQECTCDGKVQCKKASCGPAERCEVKKGVRSCQPFGHGTCTISGDPHYNTFDNGTYDFQGTCTYTAARACHLEGTRLNLFSVVVENEKWYAMTADPKVSVVKLVAVEVYGHVLILRRNQIGIIMVNGVESPIPLNLNKGAIQVYQEGLHYVIITDFGLRVTYDMIYHVTVTVPGNYWGKTCGLCGNYNGNKADEFQLPDGKVMQNNPKDILTFGAAWKVSVPGVVCEDGCSGDICPKCEDSKKAALEADCAIIKSPTGPFAACHGIIDPVSYYQDCVYDLCIAEGNRTMLCHSIAAYMTDCQNSAVKIQNWRSPTFCPLKCSANSHFEACAQPCATPCPGLSDVVSCPNTCAEGCSCNKGYYYDGTGCVSINQCSCYSDGNTYKIGETVVSDSCHRTHTCHASGVLLSQSTSCNGDETCQIKNGIMACHPKQCSLGEDGALTDFSGGSGSIEDSGTYELVKVCDQAAAPKLFRVAVKLQKSGTPMINKIMAVYAFFDHVMITITNTHEVWVNGKHLNQNSFSTIDTSLLISDNAVTINSEPGLQLSFSPANQLTISVRDKAAEFVCGACGKPIVAPMVGQQRLQFYLGGLHSRFANKDMGKWKARDL